MKKFWLITILLIHFYNSSKAQQKEEMSLRNETLNITRVNKVAGSVFKTVDVCSLVGATGSDSFLIGQPISKCVFNCAPQCTLVSRRSGHFISSILLTRAFNVFAQNAISRYNASDLEKSGRGERSFYSLSCNSPENWQILTVFL